MSGFPNWEVKLRLKKNSFSADQLNTKSEENTYKSQGKVVPKYILFVNSIVK